MVNPTDQLQHQRAQTSRQVARHVGADMESQADDLLQRALEAQTEQSAQLEAAPLEVQYSAALMAQIEAKHGQAERIEDRLEGLIEQQASRLQQAQAKQPGVFALPGTRATWQKQLQQQQTTMQRLQGRLEAVREIKEGMGIHGARIEELAARKLRAQEPELANDWDEMREARRRHEALLRRQEQEKKRAQGHEQTESTGRGLRLGLAHPR